MALLSLLITAACGPFNEPAETPVQLQTGNYAATGTWDLSGPVHEHRTVGDMAADLLVDSIVNSLPVPSALEDDARDVVDDAIHADVQSAVDGQLPASMAPDSAFMQAVGHTLSQSEVTSLIVVNAAGDNFGATHHVNEISVDVNSSTYTLTPTTTIAAGFGGGRTSATTFDIGRHTFALNYAEIFLWAARDVLQAPEVGEIETALSTATDCNQIVSTITGGSGGLDITVANQTFSADTTDLTTSCQEVTARILGSALGLFEIGIVEMDGAITVTDSDGDFLAEDLQSQAGFGGPFLVTPVPPAVAPQITATFSASHVFP